MNHVEKMIFYFWYGGRGGQPFNRVCIPLTISIPWIAVMQKQGDNDGKTKGLNILNENQPLIQISDDGVTHAFFEWQQIASKIWVHCSIKQSSLHAAIVVVSNLIFFNLPRIWMVTEFEKSNERSLASYETWEYEVGTNFRPPNRNFHTLTHEVCKKTLKCSFIEM